MNIEEMRKRVQAIVAKLDEFNGAEKYTEEDQKTIDDLNEEFSSLKRNIETQEKIEAMKKETSEPKRKVEPKANQRIEVKASYKDEKKMGFDNFGEFAMAVRNKAAGTLDRRFQNTAAYEKFSEDGGVLIPEGFMGEIQEKVQGDESLLSRCSVTPVTGNSMSIPTDENAPWSGGVQAYWTEEGGQITDSKHSFKSAHLRLKKLAALAKVTDELLSDARALESYLRRKAPAAITHKINDAIINGSGAGKPEGILNSGFTKSVAKESGQTADTIVFKNIVKMKAGLLPSANAVWLIHPQVREQLYQLKDDNGNAIYMTGGQFPNLSGPGFDMMMGHPVLPLMGAMQALGDKGDIILADLGYYEAIVKGGVQEDVSTHLLFDYAQTAFRFIVRVDGRCPYQAPVTTDNGSYTMSGFVTLAERA